MRIKFSLLAILCLFGLNTMFAQYQKLFEFNSSSDFGSPYYAQPVFDGTYFYATVSKGGAYNKGVIFRIKPDGSDYTGAATLHGLALAKLAGAEVTAAGVLADILRLVPPGARPSRRM